MFAGGAGDATCQMRARGAYALAHANQVRAKTHTQKGAPKIARAVSPLLGAFCAVLGAVAVAEGCAAAWVALAGVLGFSTALLYLYVWWSKLMNVYVKKSLADDLKDIGSFYLAKPQSHFWVAVEATEGGAGHEQVLGCVALEYKDAG
jgi:hypothetical protein